MLILIQLGIKSKQSSHIIILIGIQLEINSVCNVVSGKIKLFVRIFRNWEGLN